MDTKRKKIQNAWAMYDWANSTYNLVITSTIFPAYYVAVTSSSNPEELSYVSFFGIRIINTALQNYALALVFFLVALMSPIMSSIADYRGNKKAFMRAFALIGSLSCAALFFFTPDKIEYGIIFFSLAALGFWNSWVFYNSYLPDIASPEERDRVSAKGFAMGYFGSSFLLIAVLVAVQNPQWFGAEVTTALITRWSFVLVALWWLGFGEYSLMRLPRGAAHRSDAPKAPAKPATAYRALYRSISELLTDRSLRRFVLAFFFASAGVQTVILIASLFGSQVLGLPTSALITTILMIQYVAMAGAWLFSKMSRKWGNIPTLIVGAIGWSLVCVGAYFVQHEAQFYALGAAVGLVMGGLQSICRSTYSKMLPEAEDHVTYFSFYDIAEKLATVLGMASIGWLENATGDLRLAALVLVVYFLLSIYFWYLIRSYTFVEHQPTAS